MLIRKLEQGGVFRQVTWPNNRNFCVTDVSIWNNMATTAFSLKNMLFLDRKMTPTNRELPQYPKVMGLLVVDEKTNL